MCFGILKSNEEKFEEFLKKFYNGNKEDNIFFNFVCLCYPNKKDIANIIDTGKIYSFLDFYRKQTKMVFGKSLLENDLIKRVIFRHIYFEFKLKKPKDYENLPEGFFEDSSLKDLELYEIEFLKFILIKYYPSDKNKILAWYDEVSENKKLTYVEKTFLLQINREINFFDSEISKCEVNIKDNRKSLQVNLSELLNNHFQSGADSRLINDPNNFLSLYNKIIDIFPKDEIVIEKQDSKIVETKITKKIEQDLIYRMFELCSGSEYYTIKKNGNSYYLFKCRGKGKFLSELKFGDIVRQGNRPSFFAHIFELKKENGDEAVRFLLKKLDEMLEDKLIDEIDKASILLPFFINENISGIRVNLYDKLLSEYKNDEEIEINLIIKNIFEKSRKYLFSDYLKNYLTEEEIKKEENEDEVSEDGTKKKKLIKNSGIRDKKKSKEAKRQPEEEERLKKEKEEKEKAAAEEARKKAEEEAARKAEEEERLRKEEEARRQAEEEARRKAEEERKKAEKERLEKERLEKKKEEKVVEEFSESIPKKPKTNSVNNTQSVNRIPGKPTQEKPSKSEKPVNTSGKVYKLIKFFEDEAVNSAIDKN